MTTEVATVKRSRSDDSYKRQPKVVPGGGVVVVSRIPHGFYEQELKSYLSQFGEVTRLRLSRNPRTSASRHYAFVEFRHAEVAKIVADTMNNYLLAGHVLKCELVPEEKVHDELWKGANRKFVKIPWRQRWTEEFNKKMENVENLDERDQQMLDKVNLKIKEMDIDYDINGVIRGDL